MATFAEIDGRRNEDLLELEQTISGELRDYFEVIVSQYLERIGPRWDTITESIASEGPDDPWYDDLIAVITSASSVLRRILSDTDGAILLGALAAYDLTPHDDLEFDFDLEDPHLTAYREAASKRAVGIDERTAAIIDRISGEAARAGASVDELANRIRALDGFDNELFGVDILGHDRADRVAAFEINDRYGEGSIRWAEQSGLGLLKQWLDSRDEKVRPQHRGNSAEGPKPLDYVYPSGHTRPPTDANCRCYLNYVLR